MVRDLNFPLEIVVCPIVREPDGLAMSSRNGYLSADDRHRALILSRTLRHIEQQIATGVTSAAALIATGLGVLAQQPSARLDYLRVVDPDTLADIPDIGKGALIAIAAWIGSTRLIDNILIPPR
jgi:pantoate--beta-alanine ligase